MRHLETAVQELLNASTGDDGGKSLTGTAMLSNAKRENTPDWPEEIKLIRVVIDG